MLISASITARAIFSATWPQSIAPRLPILPRRAAAIFSLDEVALALLFDPAVRERVTVDGNVPARLAELYIEAIKEAVAVAPPGWWIKAGACLPRAAPAILRMTFLAIIITLGAWLRPHMLIDLAKLAVR
jgi:hypothetical protein